ncbi:hypothetical protein LguiA_008140 [Lonicera macranthoides]
MVYIVVPLIKSLSFWVRWLLTHNFDPPRQYAKNFGGKQPEYHQAWSFRGVDAK